MREQVLLNVYLLKTIVCYTLLFFGIIYITYIIHIISYISWLYTIEKEKGSTISLRAIEHKKNVTDILTRKKYSC